MTTARQAEVPWHPSTDIIRQTADYLAVQHAIGHYGQPARPTANQPAVHVGVFQMNDGKVAKIGLGLERYLSPLQAAQGALRGVENPRNAAIDALADNPTVARLCRLAEEVRASNRRAALTGAKLAEAESKYRVVELDAAPGFSEVLVSLSKEIEQLRAEVAGANAAAQMALQTAGDGQQALRSEAVKALRQAQLTATEEILQERRDALAQLVPLVAELADRLAEGELALAFMHHASHRSPAAIEAIVTAVREKNGAVVDPNDAVMLPDQATATPARQTHINDGKEITKPGVTDLREVPKRPAEFHQERVRQERQAQAGRSFA